MDAGILTEVLKVKEHLENLGLKGRWRQMYY